MNWLQELFLPDAHADMAQTILLLCLVVAAGIALGRIQFKGVSVGVAGVFFVGIILGNLGYRLPEALSPFLREFGLAFFVYAVGLQVGPALASAFGRTGIRLNLLTAATVFLGGGITYLFTFFVDLPIESLVGLMSGAVTNTPGLGAAQGALAEMRGLFPNRVFENPAMMYAIAYPVGVAGVLSSIVAFKMIFKINIEGEKAALEEELKAKRQNIVRVKCRVTNESESNVSIKAFLQKHKLQVVVSRQKHGGEHEVIAPEDRTFIQNRDVLMLVGTEEEVNRAIALLGRPSSDLNIESKEELETAVLLVSQRNVMNKRLGKMDTLQLFDLKITRIVRSGRELLATPETSLRFGDQLTVVGTKPAIVEASKILGNSKKQIEEPDFLSIFGGLLIGVLLGFTPIFLPNLPMPIRLGFAGGPLIAAILISRFGGIGGIHPYMHVGAINFMKDLGICLFFATVGINAGTNFIQNFIAMNGFTLMACGLLILMIPMMLLLGYCRLVLKLNFLKCAGFISGTFTSPAALAFSQGYLQSEAPLETYATVFPVATISRILVAQFLIVMCIG